MIEHKSTETKRKITILLRGCAVRQRDVDLAFTQRDTNGYSIYSTKKKRKRRKEKHYDGMINVLLYKNEEK